MSPARDSDRLAATLAGRFGAPTSTAGPPASQRWEDRHIRVTVWMDRDLRDELWSTADAAGLSRRQVVDEMARAWLVDRARSTVDRKRSR